MIGTEAATGIAVDPVLNGECSDQPRRISPATAPVAALVIPTDDEFEMASQAAALLGAHPRPAG